MLVAPSFERKDVNIRQGWPEQAQQPTAAVPDFEAASPDLSPADSDAREPELEQLRADPQSVLPKHSTVRIIGNHRTKDSLKGLTAQVVASNGLGGWHRVRLPSGEEIRLQRNALTIVSVPRGDETDFTDEDETDAQNDQSGDTGFLAPERIVARYTLPRSRRRRPTRPLSAPEYASERRVSQRQAAAAPRINFNRLDAEALQRYRIFYQLPDVAPNATKDQLVSAVGRHFMQQTVDENKVIATFITAARHQAAHPPQHAPSWD